jgi:ABC-type transport system involved in cytochrome bd biosynthesis fused ATPase/permease subunit
VKKLKDISEKGLENSFDTEVKITQASVENLDINKVNFQYSTEVINLLCTILLNIFNGEKHEKVVIVSK